MGKGNSFPKKAEGGKQESSQAKEISTPGVGPSLSEVLEGIETGFAQYVASVYFDKGTGINSFKQLKTLLTKKSNLSPNKPSAGGKNKDKKPTQQSLETVINKTVTAPLSTALTESSLILNDIGIETATISGAMWPILAAQEVITTALTSKTDGIPATLSDISGKIDALSSGWNQNAEAENNLADAITGMKQLLTNKDNAAELDIVINTADSGDYSKLTEMLKNVCSIESEPLISAIDNINKLNDIKIDNFTESLEKVNNIGSLTLDANKINEFVASFNKAIGNKKTGLLSVMGKLKAFADEMSANSEAIDKSVLSLSGLVGIISSLGDVNADDLNKLIEFVDSLADNVKHMKKSLDSIASSGLDMAAQNATAQLASLQMVMGANLSAAAQASEDNNKHLDVITGNLEKQSKELEESAERIDSSNTSNINIALQNLGSTIMAAGATMLIGGLILTLKADLILKSLLFGGILTLFMTEVLVPLAIFSLFASKLEPETLDGVAKYIITCTAIMMIGSLFMLIKNGELAKKGVEFGGCLSAFMGALLPSAILMGLFMKHGDGIEAFKNFVVTCSFIMMIGSLFMLLGGGKFAENALAFGLTLALFIGLVIAPFVLVGIVKLAEIAVVSETVKDFVTRCTVIMTVGSLFMMIGGGKFAVGALAFGLTLALFISLVMAPFLGMAVALGGIGGPDAESKAMGAAKFAMALAAIKLVESIIVKCSILLMVGAIFMTIGNGRFAVGALAFALLTGLFITLMIAPFFVFKAVAKGTLVAAGAFLALMTVSTVILLVGTIFIEKGYGWKALGFTIVLSAFIFAMCGVYKLAGKLIKTSIPAATELAILVAASALALTLGTLAVAKYGWDKTLIAAGILVAFTASIIGLALLISLSRKTINLAIKPAVALGVLMISISAALVIASFATKNVTWEDIAALGLMVGGALVIMAILADSTTTINFKEAGIAAVLIGATFIELSVAMLIASKAASWDAVAGMTIILAAMGLGLAVLRIIGKHVRVIHKGAESAVLMGLALIEISVALLIAQKIVNMDALAILGVLSVILITAAGLFSLMCKAKTDIKKGAIVIGIMCGAFILLGVAFTIFSKIEWETTLQSFAIAIIVIGVAGVLFGLLGYNSEFALAVALGAGVAALMGVAFIALGKGFQQLSKIFENGADPLFELSMLMDVLVEAGAVFTFMGVLSIPIFAGSLVGISMGNTFKIMAKSFMEVHKIFYSGGDPSADVNNLDKLIRQTKNTFALMGLMALPIALAADVSKNLSVALVLLSRAYTKLVDLKKFDLKAEDVSNCITPLIDGVKNGFKNAKGKLNLNARIRKLVRLGHALGVYAKGISPWASSKIPVAFDKDGNPTKWEKFDSSQWQTVATTIETAITTPAAAMNTAWNSMTGNGTRNWRRTLRMVTHMGEAIGNIAESLTFYAKMQIPVMWDENGKATSYRTMTTKDFENAGTGIGLVITGVGQALGDLWVGKVKDGEGNNINFQTLMNTGSGNVKNVIDACSAIGNVVKGIAEGLVSYANLQIPIEWDENGTPINFRPMTKTDFENAKNNISDIVTGVAAALTKAWNDSAKFFRKSDKIVAGCKGIGEIISSIADSVSKYANMMVPDQWHPETGKPIHYNKLTEDDFTNAQANITSITTSLINSLKSAFNSIPSDQAEVLGKIIDSFKNIGSVVNGIADGIIKLATCMVPDPTSYDVKTGKFKKYNHIDLTTLGPQLTVNLKGILTAIADSMIAVYKDNEDLFYDPDNPDNESIFSKIVNSLKGTTDIVKGAFDCVEAFAGMKVPIDWDPKTGKPKKYKKLNFDDIKDSFEANISAILTAIGNGIINAVYENGDITKMKPMFNTEDGDSPIQKALKAMQGMTKFIGEVATAVQKYAELKIPVGFNSEGKATGYLSLNPESLKTVGDNISAIVTALFSGVYIAWNSDLTGGASGIPAMTMKDWIEGSNGLGSGIIKDISTITNNLSDLLGNIAKCIKQYSDIKDLSFKKLGVSYSDGKLQISNSLDKTLIGNVSGMLYALPTAVALGWNTEYSMDDVVSYSDDFKTELDAVVGVFSKLANAVKKLQDLEKPFSELKITRTEDGKISIELLEKTEYFISSLNTLITNIAKNTDGSNIDTINDGFSYLIQVSSYTVSLANVSNKVISALQGNGKNNDLILLKDPFANLESFIDATIKFSKKYSTDENTKTNFSISIKLFDNITDIFNKIINISKQIIKTINAITPVNALMNSPKYKNTNIFDGVISAFADTQDFVDGDNKDRKSLNYIVTDINNNTPSIKTTNKTFSKVRAVISNIKHVADDFINSQQAINQINSTVTTNWNIALSNMSKMFNDASSLFGENNSNNKNDNSNSTVNLIKSINISLNKVKDTRLITTQMVGVIEDLVTMSEIADRYVEDASTKVKNGIITIDEGIAHIDEKKTKKLTKETRELNKFVQTTNKINISKVNTFINLINSLNSLASNIGNIDKLADALANKISVTLDYLAESINHSESVIKTAGQLQDRRERHIKDSIKTVNDLMNKPFNVVISRNEAGKSVSENTDITGGGSGQSNSIDNADADVNNNKKSQGSTNGKKYAQNKTDNNTTS